jgi:hypothetical protein
VSDQSLAHLSFVVHVGQWLQHGVAALGTAIPLALDVDPDTLAVHRQVQEELIALAKALQKARTQAR